LYQALVYNPIYDGCSTLTDTVRISTVGIANELANSYNLSLYPNPTAGNVHMSLQIAAEKVEIQVLDMTGRVVYIANESVSLQKLEKDINLESVNRGVYTVLISANGNKISKKLVVQ
jgi:hypothetical protein